jgi:hypothetical protein
VSDGLLGGWYGQAETIDMERQAFDDRLRKAILGLHKSPPPRINISLDDCRHCLLVAIAST